MDLRQRKALGRPPLDPAIRDLIIRLGRENPVPGAAPVDRLEQTVITSAAPGLVAVCSVARRGVGRWP